MSGSYLDLAAAVAPYFVDRLRLETRNMSGWIFFSAPYMCIRKTEISYQIRAGYLWVDLGAKITSAQQPLKLWRMSGSSAEESSTHGPIEVSMPLQLKSQSNG